LFINSSFCLEICKKIENPASCEIRLVIKFLNANLRPVEIYRQVCGVYGKNAMSNGMVRRWCRMFSEGRTNVQGDDRSGRPSLVTVDLLDQVNEKIRENRPCTQRLSSFSPLKEIFSGRMIQRQ
jgi:transposase